MKNSGANVNAQVMKRLRFRFIAASEKSEARTEDINIAAGGRRELDGILQQRAMRGEGEMGRKRVGLLAYVPDNSGASSPRSRAQPVTAMMATGRAPGNRTPDTIPPVP
jgi:hypothetical protein